MMDLNDRARLEDWSDDGDDDDVICPRCGEYESGNRFHAYPEAEIAVCHSCWLEDEVARLRGAIAAQDERDRAAAKRAGILYCGCDTSDALADEIAALRDQLAAAGEALIALLEISCVCTELDKTILKTDDGRPKLFRWDKRASEPAFSFLERHGRLENLGNGTFAARPAPAQE